MMNLKDDQRTNNLAPFVENGDFSNVCETRAEILPSVPSLHETNVTEESGKNTSCLFNAIINEKSVVNDKETRCDFERLMAPDCKVEMEDKKIENSSLSSLSNALHEPIVTKTDSNKTHDGSHIPDIIPTKTELVEQALNLQMPEKNLSTCPVRRKSIALFYRSIEAGLPPNNQMLDGENKAMSIASELEECIHGLHPNEGRHYRACVRSRAANLADRRNPGLCHRLLTGELSAQLLAAMSAEEMASPGLRRWRQTWRRETLKKYRLPEGLPGTTTTQLKCRRCECRNCTMSVVERGVLCLPAWVTPDTEGQLTLITCQGCGERWYNAGWLPP
uniref:transcription elongation factor A N-terminal and central domain-containing protein-like n=1 Tax=Myxine glutinosa TaxID=7769 RepID=UPI00358DF27D